MAPPSSTLAWKIPWTEEPGRLQSMRLLRVRHDWATSLSLSCIGEGNGNPLQCSYLENPRDRGAWWEAIYGVAQSWTRLKRLSSKHINIYPYIYLYLLYIYVYVHICIFIHIYLYIYILTCIFISIYIDINVVVESLSCIWLFYDPTELARQATLCPWDFPGRNTGVGCHCLLRVNISTDI